MEKREKKKINYKFYIYMIIIDIIILIFISFMISLYLNKNTQQCVQSGDENLASSNPFSKFMSFFASLTNAKGVYSGAGTTPLGYGIKCSKCIRDNQCGPCLDCPTDKCMAIGLGETDSRCPEGEKYCIFGSCKECFKNENCPSSKPYCQYGTCRANML